MLSRPMKLGVACFLTLLQGCAAVPFFSSLSSSEDPVERVGLEQRYQRREMGLEQDSLRIQEARELGEITLGMSMEDVLRLWGDPGSIEHAGDQPSLNQRWTYIQGLISESKIAPIRVVYFEKGKVSGWRISP